MFVTQDRPRRQPWVRRLGVQDRSHLAVAERRRSGRAGCAPASNCVWFWCVRAGACQRTLALQRLRHGVGGDPGDGHRLRRQRATARASPGATVHVDATTVTTGADGHADGHPDARAPHAVRDQDRAGRSRSRRWSRGSSPVKRRPSLLALLAAAVALGGCGLGAGKPAPRTCSVTRHPRVRLAPDRGGRASKHTVGLRDGDAHARTFIQGADAVRRRLRRGDQRRSPAIPRATTGSTTSTGSRRRRERRAPPCTRATGSGGTSTTGR